MRRVHVIGTSGCGKTTFARALAERLDTRHIELDAIFHQPDWTPLPADDFSRLVRAEAADDTWVADGNYGDVRALLWERADTVIFLDFARPTTTRRVVSRTVRRMASGEELWNGNREEWRNFFATRPEDSIILWSISRHRLDRRRYRVAPTSSRWRHVDFVRLASPRDARDWLSAV